MLGYISMPETTFAIVTATVEYTFELSLADISGADLESQRFSCIAIAQQ
jgi:hypothetical protein